MRVEGIQLLVSLIGTFLAIGALVSWRQRDVGLRICVSIAVVTAGLVWIVHSGRIVPASEAEVVNRPIRVEENGYVSSATCRACHPQPWRTWNRSYHRTMTQIAGPHSVIGHFDGTPRKLLDREYRLLREGEDFFVETSPATGGKPDRRQIVMTTGSHHMQAYWYATGDRRAVALLPFVYLRESERWIPENSSFLKQSYRQLGQTSVDNRSGEWNSGCQQCHATGQQPRLAGMDTRVADFGIACEACHGPAAEHVSSNQDPIHRYGQHFGAESDTSIVNPAKLSPRLATDICGQCHSLWQPTTETESERSLGEGFSFRPGQRLEESKYTIHRKTIPEPRVKAIQVAAGGSATFLVDRYWADGLVRITGREYAAHLDSPCFADAKSDDETLSCLSCHEMHQRTDDPRPWQEWADDQLKVGMRGNDACLPCHEELEDETRLAAHTHHDVSSSGSLCYNCHMPYTTYGLLKATRSHTITTPTVTASIATGRPNACNLCHLDRTLEWAADELHESWGVAKPQLTDDLKYFAASAYWLFKGDAGQRALLAWAYGWKEAQEASGTDWMVPLLAPSLDDSYDAVRYIAGRSLRSLPGYDSFEYDFLLPPGERESKVNEVMNLWHGRGPVATRRKEVLIGDDGRLNRCLWRRGVQQRNKVRVHLKQ